MVFSKVEEWGRRARSARAMLATLKLARVPSLNVCVNVGESQGFCFHSNICQVVCLDHIYSIIIFKVAQILDFFPHIRCTISTLP